MNSFLSISVPLSLEFLTSERRIFYNESVIVKGGFPDGSVVKDPPADAGATGLIPGWGRSPAGGNGNPLQYSCWENSIDRGTWRATDHEVAKSGT